ncbi:MAG: response regulator transcription factor, partial [Mogibacterium diversum]|nr:response regulator transcription factor [Mogibacterium diversum]
MKILVCDDDREIARAIEIYLNNEGFEVVKAHDGFEALNVVKSEDVKLAIMDVMMPKLDGIQATQMIRNEKDIPIIMLSAKSEDYDKIIGLNIGADDYVTKPFNPMELVARVKSQLRRYTQFGNANESSEEGIY